ncbi:MAG: class I SAM-dependent methyltransferase [Nitrososphaerota archaeon]
MGFSREWDDLFKKNTHLSIWPWSDLITYVMRYARPEGTNFKVLELGCGAGANIPFFLSFENVRYHAIEGSKTMVNRLKEKFPQLSNNIKVGDFTENLPFDSEFDLIFDRGALTCNTTRSIKRCLNIIYSKLKINGRYICIDLYSVMDSNFKKGNRVDEFTKNGFTEGTFAFTGNVHFSNKKHILDLFDKFNIIKLEHKIHKTEIPANNQVFASWNLVAVKN